MVARGGVVLIRVLIAGSVRGLWDDIDTTTRGMRRGQPTVQKWPTPASTWPEAAKGGPGSGV